MMSLADIVCDVKVKLQFIHWVVQYFSRLCRVHLNVYHTAQMLMTDFFIMMPSMM